MSAGELADSLDAQADALLASLADDQFSTDADGDSEIDTWVGTDIPSHVPREVVELVRTIARSERTVFQILEQADRRICRRMGRGDRALQSSRRWRVAWMHERERLEGFLRRLRDQHVFAAHWSMADSAKFRTPTRLPKNLLPWRPNEAGVLVIDDPVHVQPSFGVPAYLEPTPIKVIRYVYETWRERRVHSTGDDVCPSDFQRPTVWDLTAGSGTVGDYLAQLEKCTVIESDLTPVRDHIDCASALRLGRIGSHTGFGGLAVVHRFVRHPDLVFIDPSSRGTPSASRLYDGACGERDFAELPRDEWCETVALVSRGAVAQGSTTGLVSLLVRQGERRGGKVIAQPEILEHVKECLANPWDGLPQVVIASEVPLEFRARRAQISLGKERVPATHLLLARAS